MRQIFSAVQMMFISISLSMIGSVVANIDSIAGLGSLMTFAGGITMIVAIYRLRFENQHFAKAIRMFWIYVGLAIGLIPALLAIGYILMSGGNILWSVIPSIMVIAIGVFALRMQHQIYVGLDEMRELRALDYPPRRIMWCFYITIISCIASFVAMVGMSGVLLNAVSVGESVLNSTANTLIIAGNVMMVFTALLEAIHLWLVFTYMQAVKAAMEQETMGGWN